MRFGIAIKIISLALSLLMLSSDAALALSPAVMSGGLGNELRKGERDEIRATAQRRFAAKIGPGSFGDSLISGSEFTGDAFIKGPDGKSFLDTYGFEFADKVYSQVDDDVLYGGPELNRKIFNDGIITALKYFRDHEARISEDDLDIVEGYFEVDEDNGELPIASLEKSKDKYTLIVHTKFVQMFNHIVNNDVRFWYKFPDGQKRLVSVAGAIFYRLAKHEMSDISKKMNMPKSLGHVTQLAGISGLSVIKDETVTNTIQGRYNIINDSIWLWFLSSYAFLDYTRYNNDVFYERANWILTGEKARELDLHSEFLNLLANPEFKNHALHLAYAVNHRFFSKLSGAMPELIVEDGFIRQWRDREAAGSEEIARATKAPDEDAAGGGEKRSGGILPSAKSAVERFSSSGASKQKLPDYTDELIDALETADGIQKEAARALKILHYIVSVRVKKVRNAAKAIKDKKILYKLNRALVKNAEKTLRALEEAHGSIAGAAKELGITYPAVRYRIKYIRDSASRLKDKNLMDRLNGALVKIPAHVYKMLKVLESTDGDKSRAAEILGISAHEMNRRIRQLIEAVTASGDRDLIARQKKVMEKINRPTMPGYTDKILMMLDGTGGNQVEVAKILDISKQCVWQKIKRIEAVAYALKDERTLNRLDRVLVRNSSQARFSSSGEGARQRPSEMQSAELDHKLIKVLSRYIVKLGIDEGPGTISADEIARIWETVNLLHEDQIQVFVPYRMNPTERMRKALYDINRKSGRDAVICRGYANGGHLKRFLRQPAAAGTKRIVITDEFSKGDIIGLLDDSPGLFKGIRLLNLNLPNKYARKTAYQAKIIMMALLARMFEKDKTPMVESLLRTMLKGALGADERNMDKFVNNLDELGESEINVVQIRNRILFYLDKTVSLVEKIGREMILMKEFWIAA